MSPRRIPLARPDFDHRELDALREVLDSRWVVQGPRVEAFEQALAELHEARHCIAVSSGTAALHVAFLATGVGAGDAAFIPSFAWPAAANVAMACGARPVFVDCLEGTYNIDPEDLRARIGECVAAGLGRPRVVVPVHEFGLAAEMGAVAAAAEDLGLEVIEDAACALGATCGGRKVGGLGRAGTFSFHPRKAVTTGEGGAIVTDDDGLAEACRMYRNHGQGLVDGRRDFLVPGLNYRMTELAAAVGCVQLAKLPGTLRARKRIARRYLDGLAGCPRIRLPDDHPEHTWQTFMVVLDDALPREEVVARLAAGGIEAGPGAVSAHCAKVYQERLGCADADLPVSARLHHQGLALPVYSTMTMEDVDYCVRWLREAVGGSSR